MMITEKNVNTIWKRIIDDLEGEDIVLEIKFFDTNLKDYNRFLNYLLNSTISYEYSFEVKKQKLPFEIDIEFFESESVKEVKINIGKKLNIICGFNEVNEIGFFTNSIIRIEENEVNLLFKFIENLSVFFRKDACLFVEACPNPSSKYNHLTKTWYINKT